MPQLLRDAVASGAPLLAEEGISVKESAKGLRLPRARIGVGSRLLVGSLVVLPERLLAAIGDSAFLDTYLRPAENGNAHLGFAAVGGEREACVCVLRRPQGGVEERAVANRGQQTPRQDHERSDDQPRSDADADPREVQAPG